MSVMTINTSTTMSTDSTVEEGGNEQITYPASPDDTQIK